MNATTLDAAPVAPATRLVFLLGSMAFLTDWVTKAWAQAALADAPLELGRFTFAFIENDALVFSMGSGVVPVGAIFVARALLFAVCAAVALLSVRMPTASRAGFIFLAAGALGNLADLHFRGGAVVDFIGFDPLSLLTGRDSFHLFMNVADLWVFVGIALTFPVLRRVGRAVQARFRSWEESLLGSTRPGGRA